MVINTCDYGTLIKAFLGTLALLRLDYFGNGFYINSN